MKAEKAKIRQLLAAVITKVTGREGCLSLGMEERGMIGFLRAPP